MPDLAQELAHLKEADRHIAEAEARIAAATARQESREEQSAGQAEAAKVLKLMNSGLETFKTHRALIVSTIDDIRAGKI